jgi:hypothetical protein
MAAVRKALVGTIVAIFGVGAALGLAYSAAAKPSNSRQPQTLAKALKKCKKDKSRSRRAQCESTAKARYKSKSTSGGHKDTGTGPGTGATTGTGTATGTGAATDSGTLAGTGAVAGTGTATGTGTTTGTTATGATGTGAATGTGPETTTSRPCECISTGTLAQELLAKLALPEGAVEVAPLPGFGPTDDGLGANPDAVDVSRFWHVPGEPSAVIAAIQAAIESHPRSAIRSSEHGVSTGPGGPESWFASFSFTVREPEVAEGEELGFVAIAAEGGGTALRAVAQIIPAGAPPGPH